MVSDPNNNVDELNAPDKVAPPMFAGFASAAAPKPAPEPEEIMTPESASVFADFMKELRAKMAAENSADKKTSYAMGGEKYPYEKLWFAVGLGHQVCDCGNSIHLSATRKKPITRAQVECMVMAAIERKGWETIYMYQDGNRGKTDIQTAQAVQSVINDMRAKGKIPADCKISCCTDPSAYPKTAKDFDKMLRSLFAQSGSPDETPAGRPGFKTPTRPGLHTAPAL